MLKISHRRFLINVTRVVLACAVMVAASTVAVAQAGHLDPTFGNKGTFSDNFSGFTNLATAVAIQSDGKIIVAGETGDFGGVIRLTTSGKLDQTFGTAGLVQLKFSDVDSIATGLAIQPDGKILVAGTGIPGRGALDRLNTNGSLDNSFGSGGQVAISSNPGQLVLQPDGKVVLVGTAFSNNAPVAQMQRFNSNGQLDTSFGSNGTAPLLTAGAITLQADGKFLVGSLDRYNSNGSLDTTFGIVGQVGELAGGAIAVQSNEQIVTAGSVTAKLSLNGNSTGFGLQRFNADGSIDTAFGTHGAAITAFGKDPVTGASSLAIQSNGDIVAAGEAGSNGQELTESFALARYLNTGKLDTTFGNGGKVTTSFGANTVAGISAIAIQADGKIVAVGSMNTVGQAQNTTWEVARYLGQ